MAKTIQIEVRSVYGAEKFYPVCNNAVTFARISKTKTLDIHQLAWIESLGFEVQYFAVMAGKPHRIERA